MGKLNKILIVDDELSLVQLCQIVLKAAGYQVRGAVNGSQAMHMISQEMPDLILLDVMMPSMTGIEVCRQIRAQFHTPSPYILMYTADNRDEVRDRCMAAGANAFIPKETSIFELSQKVDAYLTDDSNHQAT